MHIQTRVTEILYEIKISKKFAKSIFELLYNIFATVFAVSNINLLEFNFTSHVFRQHYGDLDTDYVNRLLFIG